MSAEAFVEFAQPLVVVGVLRLELFDGAFLPQREDEDSREQQNRARHDGEQEVEPVLVAGDLLHETLVDLGHRARRDQDTVDRVAVDRVIQTARDVAVGAHRDLPVGRAGRPVAAGRCMRGWVLPDRRLR